MSNDRPQIRIHGIELWRNPGPWLRQVEESDFRLRTVIVGFAETVLLGSVCVTLSPLIGLQAPVFNELSNTLGVPEHQRAREHLKCVSRRPLEERTREVDTTEMIDR